MSDNILKNFAETLFQRGKEAGERQSEELFPRFFQRSDFPHSVFVQATEGGEVKEMPLIKPDRKHTVFTVDAFIGAIKKYGGTAKSAVWVNSSGHIVGILDDDTYRKSTVSLTMQETDLFKLIASMESREKSALDQIQFNRLIRREFRDSPDALRVRNSIATCKWANSEEATGVVGHGANSLGVQANNAASGIGELPESMGVHCQVFTNVGETFKYPFKIDIEVDPVARKFIVKPMPDEVTTARQKAVDDVYQRIVLGLGDKAAVFFGSP